MAEILIIDDDPGVRDVMNAALSAVGHQVREAKNGVEGLSEVRKHPPALVVTDIVMPDKEGWHCQDNLAMAADRPQAARMFPISYRRHRFPPTVIQYAV